MLLFAHWFIYICFTLFPRVSAKQLYRLMHILQGNAVSLYLKTEWFKPDWFISFFIECK